MLRGLYTAAAGMITQQRRHDTVTNNISNVNTPGFKQGTAVERSFPEMLISLTGAGGDADAVRIGSINTGVFTEENVSLYAQGDLTETRNPTDFALISNILVPDPDQPGAFIRFGANGEAITAGGQRLIQPQAFFTVQNANGEERYTRNGKFTLDELGQLVTGQGDRVLDQNRQPIQLPNFVDEITVDEQGRLFNALDGTALLGANNEPLSLFIARIDDPHQLMREGDGKFRLVGATELPQAVNDTENIQVLQGMIERSNVDSAQSMVDLMLAMRAYEANQKVVQYYDRSLDKAVNEVGRV